MTALNSKPNETFTPFLSMNTQNAPVEVKKKLDKTNHQTLMDAILLSKEEFIEKYVEYGNKGLLTIFFNGQLKKMEEFNGNKESYMDFYGIQPTVYAEPTEVTKNIEEEDDEDDFEQIMEEIKIKSPRAQRNQYATMEHKYPVGKKVAFKLPNKDQIVTGIVTSSYFRKNSKKSGPDVYEQVTVTYKKQMFFKTSMVLNKYN